MASTIFTIYGIYANIPFEYHAKKIRLPVKIRMQIDLFYTTRNLLRSLLEQTVALPQNHKIKRLVAEVLAVFTNLTVSHGELIYLENRLKRVQHSICTSYLTFVCSITIRYPKAAGRRARKIIKVKLS